MTDFSVSGSGPAPQISAADQARFFFEMDSLIPREFVGYARYLLSTIAGYESWGIPAVGAAARLRGVLQGRLARHALGQLVHQIARLEGHGRTFSMAVMTDGDPSMGYGIDTIQGVARTCCADGPRPLRPSLRRRRRRAPRRLAGSPRAPSPGSASDALVVTRHHLDEAGPRALPGRQHVTGDQRSGALGVLGDQARTSSSSSSPISSRSTSSRLQRASKPRSTSYT